MSRLPGEEADFLSYEEHSESESGSAEEEPEKKPEYPRRVGNWWLGACLGAGYSGELQVLCLA